MANRKNEVEALQPLYRLLREMTTRLVGVQSVEIDMAVDDCLEMLGKHFRVSQVGLAQLSNSGQIMPSLRTWVLK